MQEQQNKYINTKKQKIHTRQYTHTYTGSTRTLPHTRTGHTGARSVTQQLFLITPRVRFKIFCLKIADH